MPWPGSKNLLTDNRGCGISCAMSRRLLVVTLLTVLPALAAPFPDPTTGATLFVSGGAGPGQCRVEIPLDAGGWEAIAGDGPGRGYRYRKDAPGTQGVRRIVLRTGTLTIRAQGAGWPCDLSAASERLPVTVVLRVG